MVANLNVLKTLLKVCVLWKLKKIFEKVNLVL